MWCPREVTDPQHSHLQGQLKSALIPGKAAGTPGAGGGEGVCFEIPATTEQAALAPGAHPGTQVKPCNLHGKACLHLGGDPLDTLTYLLHFTNPNECPTLTGPRRETSKSHQALSMATSLVLLQGHRPCPGSW